MSSHRQNRVGRHRPRPQRHHHRHHHIADLLPLVPEVADYPPNHLVLQLNMNLEDDTDPVQADAVGRCVLGVVSSLYSAPVTLTQVVAQASSHTRRRRRNPRLQQANRAEQVPAQLTVLHLPPFEEIFRPRHQFKQQAEDGEMPELGEDVQKEVVVKTEDGEASLPNREEEEGPRIKREDWQDGLDAEEK
ncbi:hypothetical protein VTJ49DRAFT_2876 [Mycothermus thermophilus]|uniref:Uncharacterized protein n=1 Tax=Humicola insolens TaxID=85995 RepID=A0ABR3V8Y6_HUMIN